MELKSNINWTDETVKKFWDFYSQYPELYFTYQFGDNMVDHMRPFIKAGDKVLDYGCGVGFLIEKLSKINNIELFGLDYSADSVIKTNERCKGISTFKGAFNPDKLPEDLKFDVIAVTEVIEHLSDEHLASAMKEISKLLKPNGKVLFTTPNDENLSDSIVYCPISDVTFHRWQHVRSWNVDSLNTYLTSCSIKPLEMITTDFSVSLAATSGAKSWLKKLVKKAIGRKPYKQPHLMCVATI